MYGVSQPPVTPLMYCVTDVAPALVHITTMWPLPWLAAARRASVPTATRRWKPVKLPRFVKVAWYRKPLVPVTKTSSRDVDPYPMAAAGVCSDAPLLSECQPPQAPVLPALKIHLPSGPTVTECSGPSRVSSQNARNRCPRRESCRPHLGSHSGPRWWHRRGSPLRTTRRRSSTGA